MNLCLGVFWGGISLINSISFFHTSLVWVYFVTYSSLLLPDSIQSYILTSEAYMINCQVKSGPAALRLKEKPLVCSIFSKQNTKQENKLILP